jgi:signal peptidase I
MMMACILFAVILFKFVARLTRVDGGSMDNTLADGELLLVWSPGYQPQQGDIVVVNRKTSEYPGNKAIVKRVIALGGQAVDIDYDTGAVMVDGVTLDEPYLREGMRQPYPFTMQETHFDVPPGSIFVMGDNRNNSTDSRDSRLSYVEEEFILGKVVLALWPISRFGAM